MGFGTAKKIASNRSDFTPGFGLEVMGWTAENFMTGDAVGKLPEERAKLRWATDLG